MNKRSAVDDIYQLIKSKVRKEWIVAFVSCFIIGVLTYGYIMTHHFLTYDSLWNLYSDQDMISSGRQFLTYACGISSYYDFPFLNGILAVFYLSVASILLTELFRLRNYLSITLVSGILVTFPSVISTFCYTFTVDGYMLSVLIITAALFITDRKKYGFICGSILLGISLGIYQAYLAYVMVLCILLLLLKIPEEDSFKKILAKIGQYVVMGVGGYAFYLITLNIMLALKGQALSGYQGSDKVNSFSLSTLPKGIYTAFKNFFAFVVTGNVITVTNVMTCMVIILMLAGVGMYAYLFLSKGGCEKIWKMILTALLLMCLPISGSIISVLSPDTYYHTLMWTAWCLPFIFVVVLAERIGIYQSVWEGKIKRMTAVIVFTCSTVLIFEFAKVANIIGFNMEERYEKNYAIALRIVESLEETPGYSHGMKVAILGGEPNQGVFPPSDVATVDILGYFGSYGNYSLNSTTSYASFMWHYLNVSIQMTDVATEIDLMQTQEFLEMPYFPASGSIKQIGDIWVVKMNG